MGRRRNVNGHRVSRMKYTKWCPNGCGKCVWLIKNGTNALYECERCGEEFKPQELFKLQEERGLR